jgi:hypothetical protein
MSSLIISRFRMAPSRDDLSMKFAAIGCGYAFHGLGGDGGSPWWKAWLPRVATGGGVHLAGGQRHGNDAYSKAASEDRENY